MHQLHRAGEELFVNYCGPTAEVIDRSTREIHKAQTFVAVMGASNYTYAEATRSQGLEPLTKEQRSDLLELIDLRYEKKSTIISSQLPIEHWFTMIGESTFADAILDRLLHSSVKIELKGESMQRAKSH